MAYQTIICLPALLLLLMSATLAEKRQWSRDKYHITWGKRSVDGADEKREWSSNSMAMWGKRGWGGNKGMSMWGKRNDDSKADAEKREWSDKTMALWGKRGDDMDEKRSWNSKQMAMWGKRGWASKNPALWGKRGWGQGTMWGKRNAEKV